MIAIASNTDSRVRPDSFIINKWVINVKIACLIFETFISPHYKAGHSSTALPLFHEPVRRYGLHTANQ